MRIVPVNTLLVRCIEHFGTAKGGAEVFTEPHADLLWRDSQNRICRRIGAQQNGVCFTRAGKDKRQEHSNEGSEEPTARGRADRHRGLHQSYPIFMQAQALLLPVDTCTFPALPHRFRHPAGLTLCRFAAHLRHGERGEQAFRSASVAGWTSRLLCRRTSRSWTV